MDDQQLPPNLNDPNISAKETEATPATGLLAAPTFFERVGAIVRIPQLRKYIIASIFISMLIVAATIYMVGFRKIALAPTNASVPNESTQQTPTSPTEQPQQTPTSPTDPSQQPTAPNPTTPQTPADPAKPCNVAGMPQGVCDAITSIENNGIKNNQYVAVDTSQLPDSTKTTIEEASWQQTAPQLGKVNGVISYAGTSYNGVLYLGMQASGWVVTSYELTSI